MSPAALPERVLMTVDAVGGIWRYAMNLGRALGRRGTEVIFVCLGPGASPGQRREAEAIGEYVELAAPLDWLVDSADTLADVPARLSALADQVKADLLHLNLPSQAAGLETRLPVVVAAHSCVVSWFRAVRGSGVPPGWEWQHRLNSRGLTRADMVLVPSSSFAELLASCYGPIAAQVVYNSATRIPAAAKENFVLAAGRWWDEGKNGATLDAAAPGSPWPVRLAGSATSPAGQHIALGNVELLGEIDHSNLCDLIARAAIFCSPSIYEPFGLAALEAASAGAALVLSDIPTYRELWDGAALFVPPTEPEAYVEAFHRLAKSPDLRRQIGSIASIRSTRFSPEAQAAAVESAYARAVRIARHARPVAV